MKGVSPLLAGVLMISITVAVFVLLSGWMTTLTRSTEASVSNRTEEAIGCSAATIVIDSVYISAGETAPGTIYVRNAGQSVLSINSAMIINTTGGNGVPDTALPLSVEKGEIKTITFNDANISLCSDFSKATVSTTCAGVSDTWKQIPTECS